ncbi:MAG: TAXI family TRAP transporter solute-binding subunit [Candidatus Thiodiazotropha sp.]
MRRFLNTGIVATTLALFGLVASPQVSAEGDYLLATASTGGTYYPVGVALSTLVKVKLQPGEKINMSAINSAGSGENIKLLRENECQFAILQGLYGAYAWNGTGALVAGFGKKNSGSLGSSRTIFANLGTDIDTQYNLFYGGYSALASAMQDGKADLIGTPAGVPVGAVTKLLAAKGDAVRLLSFTPEQAAKADGGMELWTPYLIPAGTYPDQSADIMTIAQPNFLAVRADVSEEDVYRITKTIYENLGFLQSIHKATKAMALEKALAGLPMPLHPGAARYYKEAGLEIPARLIAK